MLKSNFKIHKSRDKFELSCTARHNINLLRSHHSLVKRKSSGIESLPSQQSTERAQINFLKAIIAKKKQQQEIQRQLKEQLKNNCKLLDHIKHTPNDYDYYDMIVRDIILEIKQQNNSPTNKIKLLKKLYSPLKDNKERDKQQTLRRTTPAISKYLSTKRDNMIFRITQYSDAVYQRKITSYLQFLYQIAFSNRIYVDLSLNSNNRYKVKVTKGNNSALVKALMKRRFWMDVSNSTEVDILWTQDTKQKIHNNQKNTKKKYQTDKATLKLKYDKVMSKKQYIQSQKYFMKSWGLQSPYPLFKPQIITNHIPNNYIISSKKVLFMLMTWYYQHVHHINPFIYIPKTYHITDHDSFNQFINQCGKKEELWIVKPGENTNRGNGINLAMTSSVNKFLKKQYHKNGESKTYMVQEYIKPFLYQSRKFDIRHYLMITSINGYIKAYWYQQGYIRTSSQLFNIDDINNNYIHLTNDAIQKYSDSYGKYQPGNKLSYSQFQRYLDSNYSHHKYNFEEQIINKMKSITTDVIRAAFTYMDPLRKSNNFQIYGMDFMIDHKFKPYLIEINANPCLQTSSTLLARIIPTMLENSFRLAVDPLYPPTQHYSLNIRYQLSDRIYENMKYHLIFDQVAEGQIYRDIIQTCPNKLALNGMLVGDDDIYDEIDGNEQEVQLQWQQQV